MKRIFASFFVIIFVLVSAFCIYLYYFSTHATQALLLKPFISVEIPRQLRSPDTSSAAENPDSTESAMEFKDTFFVKRIIEEAPSPSQSSDPHWWLNSGGELVVDKGIASSLQGDTPETSQWRIAYNRTTPVDTDNGLHPQNIFRLVQRGNWLNFSQQVYAKITRDNNSDSPQRDDSNGLFLFNRYLNGDNVYYTGLRVDGAVVIKKKYKGAYYTMSYKKILNLPKYHRAANPSLLDKNIWMGIRSEVKNLDNNRVQIDFYTDIAGIGNWKLGTTAIDDNKSFGGPSITKQGHAGIRTDFMDVQFKEYQINEQ